MGMAAADVAPCEAALQLKLKELGSHGSREHLPLEGEDARTAPVHLAFTACATLALLLSSSATSARAMQLYQCLEWRPLTKPAAAGAGVAALTSTQPAPVAGKR